MRASRPPARRTACAIRSHQASGWEAELLRRRAVGLALRRAEELRGRLARGLVLQRCRVHFAQQPLEARHYLEELAEGAEGEAVVLAFAGPDVYV
jgi:hypothetical protein